MEQLPRGETAAAGELNEGLMELGATVCLPHDPSCGSCPVAASCAAFADGRASSLPLPKRSRKWVCREMVFLVLRVGARVLLETSREGWSPGLYQPPSWILEEHSVAAAEAAAAAGLDDLGLEGVRLHRCGSVRHVITRHRIRAAVYSAELGALPDAPDWHVPGSVPLTGLARKVLQAAAATSAALPSDRA
jgi:A/G-specific adenine glycosylase